MKLIRRNAIKLVSFVFFLSIATMVNAENNQQPLDTQDNFDCIVKGITECSIPSSIEDFAACIEKVFAACSGQ